MSVPKIEHVLAFVGRFIPVETVRIPQIPRGVVFSFVVLAAVWATYKIGGAALKHYFRKKSYSSDSAQNFLLIWRYVWIIAGTVLVLASLSGSFATLGVSAAFLGAVMGWSLQAPVTGIAAWLMIMVKRPFKIGDRIIIDGIVGDVTDITLTHVILNQVGGTVGGEEKSGRGVLVPTATLFQKTIFNYSFEDKYILDEVAILVTFDSVLEEAELILEKAAEEVTRDIVKKTREEPFVRAEIADSGIRLRLRYKSLAVERQRIASEITRKVVCSFNASSSVRFAYPHLQVLYQGK